MRGERCFGREVRAREPQSPRAGREARARERAARHATVGYASGAPLVAADAVGAGVGETVLFASGSSARQTVVTNNRPVDAVIMAIVDSVEQGGEIVYTKDG